MKAFLLFPVIVVLLFFNSCREADVTGPERRSAGSGVYVVNEGGFGGGGNLSFYNPSTGSVAHNVVRTAEPWLFPNDILFHLGMVYVAVNGNDIISVVDPETDSAVAQVRMPPGTGPGFLIAAEGRIYSANYTGTVSIVDPQNDSVLATSGRVVGFPGSILAAAGRIFISDIGAWPDTGTDVIVLDPATLAVVGTVRSGGGPAGMTYAGGKIYVGGAVSKKIWRFDPVTLVLEDSAELRSAPGNLASDGSSLFVLTPDAVERIPLVTFEPDTVPLVARTGGLYFYALGFDAPAGGLYVSTILTAGGVGEVRGHDAEGRPVGSPFAAGIFPGAFGFYRPAGR